MIIVALTCGALRDLHSMEHGRGADMCTLAIWLSLYGSEPL
jgi:hypothetical protein